MTHSVSIALDRLEHHHRHHAVVLTKLSLNTRLDRSSRDVIGLNVCWTCAELGGVVRSVLDRSDREDVRLHHPRVLTLPLSVYEGTWTRSPPLIAMHLLNRSCMSVGIFLKLHAMFPNSTLRISLTEWYVSNVSIIFYCSMLLYYPFCMFMGFTLHFYIIFWD